MSEPSRVLIDRDAAWASLDAVRRFGSTEEHFAMFVAQVTDRPLLMAPAEEIVRREER